MTKAKQALGGMGHVFRFTFVQFWKSRSNLISLVILLLFSLLSLPIGSLITGGTISLGDDGYEGSINVHNESGLPLDFGRVAALDPYFAESDFRSVEQALADEIHVHIYSDTDGFFAIDIHIPDQADYPVDAQGQLSDVLETLLREAQRQSAGITAAQHALLDSALHINVMPLSDALSPAEDETVEASSWEAAYFLQLFYAVAVMMVSLLSASYIIRAVVEEKSSKLVELLMVSIQPLALIVGKILAAMLYVLSILLLIIGSFVLSYALTELFMDAGAVGGMLEGLGLSLGGMNLGFGTVCAVLVSMLLAYLTFAIISGVSGTGCSTMEEIGDANSGCSMLIMAGYLISIVVGVAENETVTTICCLLPVFSVFCAPAQYVLGNIGFGTLALSWLLQAVVIVALALFCAKVYAALLIHRGKRVKWRDMLGLAGLSRKKEVA